MLSLIFTLLIAAFSLFIGYRVWRTAPQQSDCRLFAIISVLMSLWMVFNYASLNVDNGNLFLLYVRLVMVVTDLLMIAIYLFSRSFPRGQVNLSPRWRVGLTAWAVTITFVNLSPGVFTAAKLVDDSWLPQPSWGLGLDIINMVGFLILAGVNFVRKCRRATGLAKVRLTYLTVALVGALLVALVFNLILPSFLQDSNFMDLGIAAMSLVFIGVTGYVMLKTAFSGLDFLLARFIYYATLLTWLIVPIVSCYFLILMSRPAGLILFFPFFVLWAISFVYLYNHWEKFLINKIVNHGADWEKERDRFFHRVDDELNHEVIIEETLNFFALAIKNQGNLVVGDFDDDGTVTIAGDFKLGARATALYQLSSRYWTQNLNTPLIYDQLVRPATDLLRRLRTEMERSQTAAIFPICFYDDFKGILVMSEKVNGNPYFIQDIDLIETTLQELTPLLNKAVIHQTTENFNKHLQRKIDHATRRLQRLNEQLVVADRLKDEFVSVASHELRTPMTAIKGYLWMVAHNNTPDKIEQNQHYIQIAINSTERLIALVNDMLTISRIEGGRLTLHPEVLDARTLLTDIKTDLQPLADEKGLDFILNLPRSALYIYADNKRVQEVLHNIVGNALKFTKQGSVTLRARTDHKYVYLDVIDTGVGIDPEDYSKLFSKFARMEKSYVKIKETGTGLGLYISRQIMQMHKGDITFVSELGEGSTFTIYLPLTNRRPTK